MAVGRREVESFGYGFEIAKRNELISELAAYSAVGGLDMDNIPSSCQLRCVSNGEVHAKNERARLFDG